MHTSYDALSQRNNKTQLDDWRAEFSKGETRGHSYLITKTNERDETLPSYAKVGTWLSHVGHTIAPCARAMRVILFHAPISEYRATFFLTEPVACGEGDLEARQHILTAFPRYKDRVTLLTPCISSSSPLIHRHSPFSFIGNIQIRAGTTHPPSKCKTPREDPSDEILSTLPNDCSSSKIHCVSLSFFPSFYYQSVYFSEVKPQ